MTDRPLETDLCVTCQLCCSGAFFPEVSISPAEAQTLEQYIPGICNGSSHALPQPCIALSRTEGCTAYHLRPNSCRKFTCSLLHRLNTNQIEANTAFEIVEKAQELRKTAQMAGGDEAKLANHAFKRLVKRQFLRN